MRLVQGAVGRLQGPEAAECSGHTDTSAHIAAQFTRTETGCQCSRPTTAAAAGRARGVVRIARGGIHFSVRLIIAEHERYVGGAEDDGTGFLQLAHQRTILGCSESELLRVQGARRTLHPELFLDGDGDTVQWTQRSIATCDGSIGQCGVGQGFLFAQPDQGIIPVIEVLDAGQESLCDLRGSRLTVPDHGCQFGRRSVMEAVVLGDGT